MEHVEEEPDWDVVSLALLPEVKEEAPTELPKRLRRHWQAIDANEP